MVFREQELGAFLAARDTASELLRQEGGRKRRLSLEEALVIQATSHLLTEEPTKDHVYGFELVRFLGYPAGTIVPILHRLETPYNVLTSHREQIDPRKEGRPVRRLYTPTPFGETVLAVFQPPVTR